MKHACPIFIFSLPRSGSTLLQRILSSHPDIATTPEPWLLLPLFTFDNDVNIYSNYSHKTYQCAIKGFIGNLGSGRSDYDKGVRHFIHELYTNAAHGKKYFLDKTPRYHLIIEDIIRVFPSAKFIFLWRNPLSIMSSISRTWSNGGWAMVDYHVDLYDGCNALLSSYKKHADRCISINYEDVVLGQGGAIERLEEYLDVEKHSLNTARVKTRGFMSPKLGDPTGVEEYADKISTDSLERWKESFINIYRRNFASKYLDWLGEDNLRSMGYDISILKSDLRSINGNKCLVKDVYESTVDKFKCLMQSRVLRENLDKVSNGRVINRLH